MSGRVSWYRRTTLSHCTRSKSLRRGTKTSFADFARSLSTTNEPRNPDPPVTRTRLSSQKLMISGSGESRGLFGFCLEVSFNHQPDEFLESYAGFPAESLGRFRRIS